MAKHAPIFHAAAEAAGVILVPNVKLAWLTRHGHLALNVAGRLPAKTIAVLDTILTVLDGDAGVLAAKARGGMSADFLHATSSLEVEYDEIQHFTTARIATLELYPPDALLAFAPATHIKLIERWRSRGDRGFAHKQAVEFPGPAGRQRQRAYFDAFRDLAAPHFGNGPVLRVPAPDNDYRRAVDDLTAMIADLGSR